MSIFKVKHWWSNNKSQTVESDEGVQNNSCLKVDKFNSHSDSDCIIIGEVNVLKIYKPHREQDAAHSLIEMEMSSTILQIETGKFVAGSTDRQILVLHPQSYVVYQLHRKEGHTDAGEQNLLQSVIKHSFTRKAYSVSCGSFGHIKTRDFICIQALDGTLSFFDQEIFLFMYMFNDVIIPGPICYIPSSDSFVICKSTWVLEIYSFQQLREFSELNARQNKKIIPQWVYNAGEEISSLQVIQTSSNISSIIALGERHLYCFQDNGLMKFMIKFEFIPVCFCGYLIGWYYEPTARLLVMVASNESKLYIYEGTTLLWSCDLLQPAIAISRCFLKYLPGGLVTLSTNGVVNVCYLGTEPDLNSNAPAIVNDTIDPEKVQTELESVEEALQKILDGKEDADSGYPAIDQIIKIKADVGKPVQNLFEQFTKDEDQALHLLMCPIVLIVTCEDPKMIQNLQITYDCFLPFTCSDPIITLDNINGTEIIETQVFLSSESDISNTNVNILLTITDSTGKLHVLKKEVMLPLSLYCLPTEDVDVNGVQLVLNASHDCIDLTEIFTDFSKEELLKHGNIHSLKFVYRATKKTVTVKAMKKQYYIEASDITEITAIFLHIVVKLHQYNSRMNITDCRFNVILGEDFIKQIIHRFLKSIETHAKERIQLDSSQEELTVLQRQFTLIQKKLLVQYGSLPPGDCDPLEFIMKDTHQCLITCAHDIISYKTATCNAGCSLAAIGMLLVFIFRETIQDGFKVKLVEEMLTLGSLYEDNQGWEEAVTQAATYVINNVFQKSEKDKEKLAPVTEQGILSHVNLKRFLKQIRMILEKLFTEARGHDVETKVENRVTRIEEFVEVI